MNAKSKSDQRKTRTRKKSSGKTSRRKKSLDESTNFFEKHQKRIFHILILSAASVGVWSVGTFGEFVWVDKVEIVEGGYRITSAEDAIRIWTTSSDAYVERHKEQLETGGGYLLHPVYAAAISADWMLWKDNPFLYKLANIGWHLFVVIGLYFLGLQILHKRKHRSQMALAAALLFAVHPFCIHSVTWISGRKDTMCVAFALVSLIAFGKLLQRSSSKKKSKQYARSPLIILLVLFFSLNLALFSKELAIVTPLFAAAWFWFEKRKSRSKSAASIGLVVMWCCSMVAIAYRYFMLGGFGLNSDYPSSSVFLSIATSARLLSYYLVRVAFPKDPTIVDRWEISQSLGIIELVSLSVVLIGLGSLLYLLWKRRTIGLALSWFAIWLLPATGLVPLRHFYAERYLYPAIWGLCLFGVLLVFFLTEKLKHSRRFKKADQLRPFACAAIALVFGFFSLQSIRYYSTDSELFQHAIRQNPNYVEGLSALALHHLEKNDYEEALEYSERAIRSAQDANYKSYTLLHVIFSHAGVAAYHLNDDTTATTYLQKALETKPNNAQDHYVLAKAASRLNDQGLAISSFKKAIEIQPDYHESRNELGRLYLNQSEFGKCVDILTPTVLAQPDNLQARANLGSALIRIGNFEDAIDHINRLVQEDSANATNLAKLAWCQFELGKTNEAWVSLRQAFAQNPDDPTAIFVGRKYRDQNRP